MRVIVTASGRLPLHAQVLGDAHAGCTLVATTPAGACRLSRTRTAARILTLPAQGGKIELAALLQKLGDCGVLHVLCEGGGRLAAGLLRAGLVDELQLFLAPKLLGGDATPAIASAGWLLENAPALEILEVRRIGPDLLIRARPSTINP
jgi:diaminohydroxyphosphoribosylaminopyrimidine deaminase/5-amino-6-(5-phosphoribosylamino)uracil reductase